MKITIEGNKKEIADLVKILQDRQSQTSKESEIESKLEKIADEHAYDLKKTIEHFKELSAKCSELESRILAIECPAIDACNGGV